MTVVNGVLPLVKPGGMTSHDVVICVRKILGMKRVGHTGTLDPDAEGVLIILLGKATRLMQFMVTLPKTYVAEIIIGITTDTLDASGKIISKAKGIEIPKKRFLEALSYFQGEIQQIPPMVSAVHYKGQRLYELARKGLEAERKPRKVCIYKTSIQEWPKRDTLILGDRISILVECSSGTYVRQLAADIGDYLGCGAHIGSLFRTKVGDFDISLCHTLEEIKDASSKKEIDTKILPMINGLSHLPIIILSEEDLDLKRRLCNGNPYPINKLPKIIKKDGAMQVSDWDFISVVDSSYRLICVARRQIIKDVDCIQPVSVFMDALDMEVI